MSADENKAVYRRWLRELWEEGELAAAVELIAPDFVDRAPYPGVIADREGHKQVVAMLHAAFPDWRFTIEHLVAEGDKVVGRWRMDATHGGDIAFMGIPASGKQVAMTGKEVHHAATRS